MSGPTSSSSNSERTPQALRQQAENLAFKNQSRLLSSLEPPSAEKVRQILHELRVHQIELEMQNEELRRIQQELEAARARYFNLYDMAPVGYCTLNESGQIVEANLTAVALLGVDWSALVMQPITRFIFKRRSGHLLPAAPTVIDGRRFADLRVAHAKK